LYSLHHRNFQTVLATLRTYGQKGNCEEKTRIYTMAKINPAQYVNEVKAEMKKVTWPTRKETTVSTIAVFIMVTLAATFLFLADQILAWGVDKILSIGSGL
jgi:preprotein translocase subunit SecE